MISLTSPVKTRAHDLPAGLKLALLVVATGGLARADGLAFHTGAALFSVSLYALPGRVFFTAGLKRLSILWPFAAVVLAWHLVTRDVEAGLVITLRMLSAVGLANLVTMTTRLSDIMAVVRWLGTPLARLGLNMAALEIGIGLVIRMVPVLGEKARHLTESWRARSPRRARWRVVLPLAVLALEDADRVSEALRARGGLTRPDKD
ncbi:MAG TPA: ABC transporter permease [Rhodobacteraceae bacterium]|nr:ABC transporter permease [Paracoccaceae bacterium]